MWLYDFKYKSPEISIVNIVMVFVLSRLFHRFWIFWCRTDAFHNHKTYSDHISKFLVFSVLHHLLIFQVCCFQKSGRNGVGLEMKRERAWPNICECKYCYFSFLYLVLKEESFWTSILEFPLAFHICFLIRFSNSCSAAPLSLSLSLSLLSHCFSHCLTLSLCMNLSHSLMLPLFIIFCRYFSGFLHLPEYTKTKQNKKYLNSGIPEVWTHKYLERYFRISSQSHIIFKNIYV